MNMLLPQKQADPRLGQIIKLAVMAVGGQGGGVLTSWIESLARAQGYACQATSVAGVAQRTGATIYYIEMTPVSEQQPVFALAPSEGDVDIVVAAEMMEAGRAISRGFVTPDCTTLIGSTHRALAVSEKMVPGDGIADAAEVWAAAELAAQRLILADMEKLAIENGSVISASLFGALAGSEALPFPRAAFEDAIRQSGKGVEPSLCAFAAGYAAASQDQEQPEHSDAIVSEEKMEGPPKALALWQALVDRVQAMPKPVAEMALSGVEKVVDFQDCTYGKTYLDRLDGVIAQDDAEHEWELSTVAAKYIANAMAYDDIIRVADLKTRARRFSRIKNEMGADAAKVVELTEFFHPRAEEIASLMPARMGEVWERSPKRMALLTRFFGKGRRLRTHTLRSFLMLHFLGGLKSYRLRTRRHQVEVKHMEQWLNASLAPLDRDYRLCVELLKNRRLIKGYSDTHARAKTKFNTVMEATTLLDGRDDAAEWMNRLREAALKDPKGEALEGAIKTIKSFI